jgi:hypothetical protein
MKKQLLRPLLAVAALTTALFTSGCAQIVDGLNAIADELDRQNQACAYAAYYQYYYAPRVPGDTSAGGIK